MSTAMMDGGRKRSYTIEEINEIVQAEGISPEETTFFTAISSTAMVIDSKPVGLRSVTVPVIETDTYQTGHHTHPARGVILVINTETSVLDYDFISELHPMHDWDVYLWTMYPWDSGEQRLGVFGEWYRRDVYPDGISPFDGETLGWEDSNNNTREEDND